MVCHFGGYLWITGGFFPQSSVSQAYLLSFYIQQAKVVNVLTRKTNSSKSSCSGKLKLFCIDMRSSLGSSVHTILPSCVCREQLPLHFLVEMFCWQSLSPLQLKKLWVTKKQLELFLPSKGLQRSVTSLVLFLLKKDLGLFVFRFKFILPNLLLEYDNRSIKKDFQFLSCLKSKPLNSRIIGIQLHLSFLYEALSILSQAYSHHFDPFHRQNWEGSMGLCVSIQVCVIPKEGVTAL